MERGSRSFQYAIAAGVFLAFFILFASLQFMSPSLTSQDDGYYHIRHSLEYCSDSPPVHMPVYSTMDSRPSDLYIGYHYLMCPFTAGWSDGYAGQVAGFKIYNSLLAAGWSAAFFLVAYGLFAAKAARRRDAALLSLAAVLYLYTSNSIFFGRIYFARPHMTSIAAVFLAYYFIEKRMWRSLFATALLLPLFYSVSFVVLYPAIMFLVASAVYERRIFSRDAWKPLGIALCGLIAGIALHPDAANYAYNAFYVHLRAVVNRFAAPGIGEGSELYTPGVHLRNDFLWLAPWLPIVSVYAARVIELKSLRKSIGFSDFNLLLQTAVLLPGFLFIERVAEYFIPYMALLVTTLALSAFRWFPRWNAEYEETADRPASRAEAVRQVPFALASGLYRSRRWLAGFLVVWFALALGINYHRFAVAASREKALDEYLGAAKFMEANSSAGDIVFIIGFDQYPRLVVFNDTNRYIMGMGATFTYMRDSSLYWRYYHIVHNEPICGMEFCPEGEGEDLYRVLKEEFKARFFFADTTRIFFQNDGKRSGIYDRIASDPRFAKVYADPVRPHISVYEL